MKTLLLGLIVAGLLAACGSPPPAPATSSGIQGTVTIGPTCPVERVTSPCPPRRVKATIEIRDSSGNPVRQFVSGPDGHFQVNLAPGTYTLIGARNASGFPRPIPVTVTVVAGAYSSVTVQFDSGIR